MGQYGYEREENTERVACDMHWRDEVLYIEEGQPINYRMTDDGAVDAIACDDCARHFEWPCIDHGPDNRGKWGPAITTKEAAGHGPA